MKSENSCVPTACESLTTRVSAIPRFDKPLVRFPPVSIDQWLSESLEATKAVAENPALRLEVARYLS
jgi:hypothetical protein